MALVGIGNSQNQPPKKTLAKPTPRPAVFGVAFQEHLATPSGGTAFDRINTEVGANRLGDRRVLAVVQPPTAPVQFISLSTPVASVEPRELTPEGRVMRIVGNARGLTAIQAKGYSERKLGTYVFADLSREVALHSICDLAGVCTSVSLEAARAFLNGATAIWDQANVEFSVISADTRTVQGAFDGSVKLGTGGTASVDEDIVTEARNTGVRTNIYFVFALTRGGEPHHGFWRRQLVDGELVDDIFISDAAPDKNDIAAHELGHSLGINELNDATSPAYADYIDLPNTPESLSRKYELMHRNDSRVGRSITPRQGDVANKVR